jgi:thiamine biosynthesis lipoprotein
MNSILLSTRAGAILLFLVYGDPFTAAAQDAIRIQGQTMGTSYHITYFDKHQRDFKPAIDSMLLKVNASINTYDPGSEVSRFNKSPRGFRFVLPYFYPVLKKALEVAAISHGAFDPTIMPLVNAWGFGPAKSTTFNRSTIDSLKRFVGFEKIVLTKDSVTKRDPRVQLDFGGIGQGYGADLIIDFLRSKGISNMLVELGGEGVACGKNLEKNKPWQIGITDPHSTYENQFFKAYVTLTDKSFTTAGNYFNYREIDGKKYSHTIDPVSGYPVDLPLLSASVFAADCITADAWDTAFMVMGHTKAIEVLNDHPELDAILFYTGAEGKTETYITEGIRPFVILEP